jgi:iron complex transport system substrate-binding protein
MSGLANPLRQRADPTDMRIADDGHFSCRRTGHTLATVWLALALMGMTAAHAGNVSVTDANDRKVEAADTRRIVSIGGAVTEILYALGQEERIVAVDATSLYPREALAKPNVGYMRQLSAEGVLGLNPSLVLAAKDSGPKETMAVLAAARIPLVLVPDRYDGEGVIEKIGVVAQAVGMPARGECLAAAVRRDLDALAHLRRRIAKPLRVMFVLSLVNGRPMVAGLDTAANGIIALAGGVNAVTEYAGYKPVSEEAVIAAAPDVVLVMQRSGESIAADDVFGLAAFSTTPAAAQRAFVSMDGLYLLGFGPRTAQAARDLSAALYPDVEKAGEPLAPAPADGECR